VRAEVVEHNPDAVSIRVVLINKPFHECHPVFRGSSAFDRDNPPSIERFCDEEVIFRPLWFVVVLILTCDRARIRRARVAQMCNIVEQNVHRTRQQDSPDRTVRDRARERLLCGRRTRYFGRGGSPIVWIGETAILF
jgi:hypothetical protein